jgi:hypothetical protein
MQALELHTQTWQSTAKLDCRIVITLHQKQKQTQEKKTHNAIMQLRQRLAYQVAQLAIVSLYIMPVTRSAVQT